MDSISIEDLMLISAILQDVKINFDNFMIGKVRSIFEMAVKQKLLSVKRAISLPYGKFIYKILVVLGISTQSLHILLSTKDSINHISLLYAHFCHYQEN